MKNKDAKRILSSIDRDKLSESEAGAIRVAIEALERAADEWGQEDFVAGLFVPNYEEPKSCQDCEWYVERHIDKERRWVLTPVCTVNGMVLVNKPWDRSNDCPLAMVMLHEDDYGEMRIEGWKA